VSERNAGDRRKLFDKWTLWGMEKGGGSGGCGCSGFND